MEDGCPDLNFSGSVGPDLPVVGDKYAGVVVD